MCVEAAPLLAPELASVSGSSVWLWLRFRRTLGLGHAGKSGLGLRVLCPCPLA